MADVKTRRIESGAVTAAKLSNALRQGKYIRERFDHQPQLSAPNGYGDPTGSTGDINWALFRSGLAAQYAVLGAGQTLLGPLFAAATGKVDISQDATVDEGVEYIWGGNSPRNPFAHTVGTTERSSYRLEVELEDISGVGTLLIGWRKQEALQADWNDYDELVAWNVTAGVLTIEEILNAAATVQRTSGATAITADAATPEFRVDIDGDGKAYFFYEGVQYFASRFDFDNAEVVVPFLHYKHATDISLVKPLDLEIGPTRELRARP